jgi:hypothetical protein
MECWLQRDGATALLQELFGERIDGHGVWPPRSPNLASHAAFCAGFSQKNFMGSLDLLTHNIEQTFANTDSEELGKVAGNNEMSECFFSKRWWAILFSAVKLFCKFS